MSAPKPKTVPTRCAVCRTITAGTRTCIRCQRSQPELPFPPSPRKTARAGSTRRRPRREG